MISDRPLQLALILLIEAAVGYPDAVYRRVRHPVVWMGRAIAALDRSWNKGCEAARRIAGVAAVVALVSVVGMCGWALEQFALAWEPAILLLIFAGTAMLAQRSLHEHVSAVLRPLESGDLAAAREAVGRIVGRDTHELDSQGVATAAVESLAESFCDGIVAPAFWFLVAGLPGLFICKLINTADSMIGHRDARHRAFGWAAARADDLMNLVPARLAGLLICVAGVRGVRVMLRDAPHHASPNAGWPEAAMAGALGRQLGGSVSYDGVPAHRPLLGKGPRPDAHSLRAGRRVYWRACVLLWLAVGVLAWPQ
ncbi:MAG: cobalamin biosynthesis protein CobD [Steroidobacteraceae bacterium]|nr:cobalamin biosynthesis protein CobD [Steroidobacteraceae bacterium]